MQYILTEQELEVLVKEAQERKTISFKLEEAQADIRELNDRPIERQESFQAQLIRIEDTWRKKLAAQKAELG